MIWLSHSPGLISKAPAAGAAIVLDCSFAVYLYGGYAKCEHPTAAAMLNLLPPTISTDITSSKRCQENYGTRRRSQVDGICDKTKLYNFSDEYGTSFVSGAFETPQNSKYKIGDLSYRTDGDGVFSCGSQVSGFKCNARGSVAVLLGVNITKEECNSLCSFQETRLSTGSNALRTDETGRTYGTHINDGTRCCEYSDTSCYACDQQCISAGSAYSAATCTADYELFDRVTCIDTSIGTSFAWGENVFNEIPDFIEVATMEQALMGLPVLTDFIATDRSKVGIPDGYFKVDSTVFGHVGELSLTVDYVVVSSFSDYKIDGSNNYQGTESDLVFELVDQHGEVVEMCSQNTETYKIHESLCDLDGTGTYRNTKPCRFEGRKPVIPIEALFEASGVSMDAYNTEWNQACVSHYFHLYLGSYTSNGQEGLEEANLFFYLNASRFANFEELRRDMLQSGLALACKYAAIPRFGTTFNLNVVYSNLRINGADAITVQMNAVAKPSFMRERGQSQKFETAPIMTGPFRGEYWRKFTGSHGITIRILHDGEICNFDFQTLLLTLTSALGLLAIATIVTDLIMVHIDPPLWKSKYDSVDTQGHHFQHHKKHLMQHLRKHLPQIINSRHGKQPNAIEMQQQRRQSTSAGIAALKAHKAKRTHMMAPSSNQITAPKSRHSTRDHHQSHPQVAHMNLATAAISRKSAASQVHHECNSNKHKHHRDEIGHSLYVSHRTAHSTIDNPRNERKHHSDRHKHRRSKSGKAADANHASASGSEVFPELTAHYLYHPSKPSSIELNY